MPVGRTWINGGAMLGGGLAVDPVGFGPGVVTPLAAQVLDVGTQRTDSPTRADVNGQDVAPAVRLGVESEVLNINVVVDVVVAHSADKADGVRIGDDGPKVVVAITVAILSVKVELRFVDAAVDSQLAAERDTGGATTNPDVHGDAAAIRRSDRTVSFTGAKGDLTRLVGCPADGLARCAHTHPPSFDYQ